MRKVLYVGYKNELHIKNSLSFSYKAWYETFKDLNFELRGLFPDSKDFKEQNIEYLNIKLKDFKPDLVFVIINKNYLDIKFINHLKSITTNLVGFSGDDNWNFDSIKTIAVHFDKIVTTDHLSINKYKKLR